MLPLVEQMALADQVHQAADKEAKQGQDNVNGDVHFDHQVIHPGHDQNGEVLVEILHRD